MAEIFSLQNRILQSQLKKQVDTTISKNWALQILYLVQSLFIIYSV